MTRSDNKIIIFDTTLRDGEQSPGASMNISQKVEFALALERLGVDVIEAGFPAASEGDFAAVSAVSQHITKSRVCGLARAKRQDIERVGAAVKAAPCARIHTFIATSPIHMQKKLCLSPDAVVEAATEAVRYARQLTDDVEFSAEDAGRSDTDFLCRIVEAVIDAGARTVNLPDTVGYCLPEEYGAIIEDIMCRVPNADKAIFSVHCHNDLGLAVANSLAGVAHGARQIECAVNGLGERAGNAALEEVVMALKTRKDKLLCHTEVDSTQLLACSRLLAQITGFTVQPNKAIVGRNAFAHESGIHQDGVLKQRQTYEIMQAKDVGWPDHVKMVLGKLSGRNALRTRLQALGVLPEVEDFESLFTDFKLLADKGEVVEDDALRALVEERLERLAAAENV